VIVAISFRTVLCAVWCWLIASALYVQPVLASVNGAVRISAPQLVDDAKVVPFDSTALAGTVWEHALVADRFESVTARSRARLVTTAYLLYSRTRLYVAFHCERGGVPLTATQVTNNVGAGLDDDVEVDLDPTTNGKRTYSYQVTPNGIRYQQSTESARYDPPWTARASVHPAYWDAELIVPLNAIRTRAGSAQNWRINFVRHVAATNEDYSWAFDPVQTSLSASVYWPEIVGFTIPPLASRPGPYANVYALGDGGSDRTSFENQTGSFVRQEPRHFGVDATYPISRTLALVATLAPDFSNVDQDQLTIAPQEFRRTFSEFRPFFAQGASYLTPGPSIGVTTIPDSPFYTPSIGIFDRGVKLEGTAGLYGIGALNVRGEGFDDTAYGVSYRTPNRMLDLFTSGVLAHHSDIGTDETVGLGGTVRNAARTVALAVNYQMERGSLIDKTGLADDLFTYLSYGTQSTNAFIAYRNIGPEYAPIDGFVAQNDIRGPQASFQYNGVPKRGGRIKSYTFTLTGDRYTDRSGAPRQVDLFANVGVTLKSLLSVTFGQQTSGLRIYEQPYPVYANPSQLRFDQSSVALGFRDGTPTPIDVSYSWGPFASYCTGVWPQPLFCGKNQPGGFVPSYVTQFSLSGSRPLNRTYQVSAEIDSTSEQPLTGVRDGQWLRRLSLTRALGANGTFALELRTISGTGGFGIPGTNVAAALHLHSSRGNELYLDFGSPASAATLDRLLIKYLFHVGSGTGT
jgi:hypothetical protein